MLYFTNIDNLYISLYFTILVLWSLQLQVQQIPCSPWIPYILYGLHLLFVLQFIFLFIPLP